MREPTPSWGFSHIREGVSGKTWRSVPRRVLDVEKTRPRIIVASKGSAKKGACSVKVAAVQMNCVRGDVRANLRTAGALLDEASARGVRWSVLPELFASGYHVEGDDAAFAETTASGPICTWLRNQAQRRSMFVSAGFIEALPSGVLADSTITVRPDGTVASLYRKCHLWSGERARFEPGKNLAEPFFLEDGFVAAAQICYEVGFPEGARTCAVQGANVLAYSAAFGLARLHVWDIATRARALENGCYVIASGLCGTEGDFPPFAGSSRVVSPQGCVMAQVDEGDGLAVANIDLDEVRRARAEIPYLNDLNRAAVIEAWNRIEACGNDEGGNRGGMQ